MALQHFLQIVSIKHTKLDHLKRKINPILAHYWCTDMFFGEKYNFEKTGRSLKKMQPVQGFFFPPKVEVCGGNLTTKKVIDKSALKKKMLSHHLKATHNVKLYYAALSVHISHTLDLTNRP